MVPKPTYEELENRVKELEKDAVARKGAEEALRESEERFEQIAEQSCTIAWEVNADGLYTYISHLSGQILGYHPEEIISKMHFYDLHPEEGREAFKAAAFEVFARKESFVNLVNAVQTKTGACVWMSTNGIPLLNPDGTLRGYRGSDTDITERKNALEALRESEDRYRTAIEHSNDGVAIVERDRHVFVNRRFAEIFGYDSPDEINGQPVSFIVHPYDKERVARFVRRRLAGESVPSRYEFKGMRKDGNVVHIEVSAARTTYQGKEVALAYLRDITERKQAEEALRESEEKLRIRNRIAAIFLTKTDQEMYQEILELVLDKLKSSFGVFGYIDDKGSLVCPSMTRTIWDQCQMPDKDIVFPEDTWGDSIWGNGLRTRKSVYANRLFKVPEGHIPIERCLTVPLVFQDRSIGLLTVANKATDYDESDRETLETIAEYVAPVLQGILERKSVERALQDNEEKYRNLFTDAQVALFRIRMSDGALIAINERYARMAGYSSIEECMENYNPGKSWINPYERDEFFRFLRKSNIVDNYEREFIRGNGERIWITFSATLYPEKGYLEGSIEDITARKQAEEALRHSREEYRSLYEKSRQEYELYRSILHTSADAIVSYDLEGKVQYVNPSFTDIFGWTLEELKGKWVPFLPDSEREATLEGIKVIMEYGKPIRGFKTKRYTKDGRTVSVSISGSRYNDHSGNPAGMLVILRDTSLEKKLEAQLQRAQKMEALGLLAGGVAHDLNNILSGIVSYPELILMDLPEDSPLRKPMKTIHESGMRAAGVVSDLLTVARGVATGKETLNLNSIVNEYLGSPEYQKLEEMHPVVNLRTDLDCHLLNMRGSPIHLKKTLMNLVTNASEAIEGGGTVTISTFNRYLDEPLKGYDDVRTGEYVVLSVSDNGTGISSKDIERIFEPFYTKKVMGRSGTGLGLAVVWNTVQDHNGYINVETSKKGTVFELYFPVTRKEIAAEKEPVDLKGYMGRGEKILVVDDEESQREIAIGILTKLGYHAEAVSSGEEAIEHVRTNLVNLIVLDMVMPKGINGHETYKEIIKIRPGQKAIIASGYAKTEEVTAAQSIGAGKYIKKPYTLEKIGVAVKEELEK